MRAHGIAAALAVDGACAVAAASSRMKVCGNTGWNRYWQVLLTDSMLVTFRPFSPPSPINEALTDIR